MTSRSTTEPESTGSGLRLSVVIPAFNSAASIDASVRAVVRAAGPSDEIILVDDGSTDGCVANLDPELLARITAITSPTNIGRGPARNLGARSATGEILVFIDSDVAIEQSALERFRAAFTAKPDRAAIIGSYDDHPHDNGRISQYRNLLHHHTHHTHGSYASHFWTGIGAVRKDVFIEVGGLDTGKWAREIEDVEFGHRIIDAGYAIEVMPDICGTHYKSFTFRSMVSLDLRHRAIPWSHLMIASRFRSDPFVTSPPQVLSAFTVALVLLALLITPFFHIAGWGALLAFLAFLLVNASLWKMLAERRGVLFALLCVPLHFTHTAISGFGFVIAIGQRLWEGLVGGRLGRRTSRPKQDQGSGSSEVSV